MFKQLLIFVLFGMSSLVCAETIISVTPSSKAVVSIEANGNSASAAAGNGTVIITDTSNGNIDIKIEVVTDEDFDVFDNDDFFK